MRRCDIELKSVSNDEWKMKLKTANDQSSALESIAKIFLDSIFREGDVVSADQFHSTICTLDCPSFDQDYVLKWLRFIRHSIIRN
jgi:hypothetical protein